MIHISGHFLTKFFQVPSHKEVQAGVVEFGVQDKIMVHLDNTHSRFTSKIVTYSIIVVHQKQSNQVEKCIETLVIYGEISFKYYKMLQRVLSIANNLTII